MTSKLLLSLATAGLLALPVAAQAQGTRLRAAGRAAAGSAAAGPVGGIGGGAAREWRRLACRHSSPSPLTSCC
ncbi:hypothetical protein [Methylobacterium radiotolerans]|uniref:hypothetical protein n=1 Tax=Methylobacterium radiotolerans TaxID=31998 RepID=UPI000B76F080|nr:hypothetical protein [Methylobacterium radiotolerans]OXE37716.1 hypothetical protein CCS92_35670 [Methylobacterium radiotolerans]